VRGAADASFTVYVPIPIPSNSVAERGSYLKSVELMYRIITSAADDFATVALYKDTLPGSGPVVTTTIDAGHDTAAERKAIDKHRMVVTLSTPEWIDNDIAFHLECVVDAAADTSFRVFGAIVNYTMRL
jgi:hypothetical protein